MNVYNTQQYQWFEQKGQEQAKSIFRTVQQIDFNDALLNNHFRHFKLYDGQNLAGLPSSVFSRFSGAQTNASKPVLGLNVVQAVVDTMVNSLCAEQVKVSILTEGGSIKLQRKAKKQNKFLLGMFLKEKVHEKVTSAIKNGSIFGTGVLKVYVQDGRPQIDVVPTHELLVDGGDGLYGEPRTLYQIRFVPRYLLLKRYPKFKMEIDELKSESILTDNSVVTDCVKVIEAWHLSSSKDAKDGVHSIAVENAQLFTETWEREDFPFVFYRHNTLPMGFFGRGVAQELIPLQFEINHLLQRASEMLRLQAVPRVLIEESSNVNSKHITNEIGSIIK